MYVYTRLVSLVSGAGFLAELFLAGTTVGEGGEMAGNEVTAGS